MDIYNSYGVSLKVQGGAVTTIGGVMNQSLNLGTEHNAEPTAGAIRPQHAEVTAIKPRGSFSCYDIATLLNIIGAEGSCLEIDTAVGFDLYQLKLLKCGTIATGSVHRKLTIPNGRITPQTLSCGHRQNAELTCEVISTYDGTNAPVIIATAQAAPTGLDDLFRFTLGAVSVGGVAIAGNTNIDINFGVEVQAEAGDSDIYDTHLIVTTVKPEITITTRDVSQFGSGGIGLTGLHGTHANSSIQLRRRVNATGDFSAAADSIEITFDGMVAIEQAHSAQGNNRGEMTIKITALDDGTNAPLVFDYAFDLVP